jgi:hypothetical protein
MGAYLSVCDKHKRIGDATADHVVKRLFDLGWIVAIDERRVNALEASTGCLRSFGAMRFGARLAAHWRVTIDMVGSPASGFASRRLPLFGMMLWSDPLRCPPDISEPAWGGLVGGIRALPHLTLEFVPLI